MLGVIRLVRITNKCNHRDMTTSPLRDSLTKLRASGMDYIVMSVNADQARSHSWLKNMAEQGAWGKAGAGRVGPPTPDQFPGLAKLLGTTEESVAAMVATDFYGVDTSVGYSARVRRIAPILDTLEEPDADLVEQMVARLAK
jgi:hypothetical protein